MNNTFHTLMLCCFALACLLVAQNYKMSQMYTREQVEQLIAEEGYNTQAEVWAEVRATEPEATQLYNDGYVMGRMDMLSELVECEDMHDDYIMENYLTLGEELNGRGMLGIMHCEE